MASGVFDDALIKHLWSTDELCAIFSDRNRVQKWYDYEAALALEQAALGIIPGDAAREIAGKARIENVDIEAMAAEIRRIKHPLVPALKALQAQCAPEHGEYIHFGPTTQDVLDTATVLQIKDAHAVYLRDMKAMIYFALSQMRHGYCAPAPASNSAKVSEISEIEGRSGAGSTWAREGVPPDCRGA